MAFIGNTNTTQAFTPAIDYFSGNGSTTAFTLSRPVASVAQVQVTIDNVAQNPSSAYTVSSNTITFTSAPLSGTNNIYVYYTSPITQVIAPGQGTVTATSMASSTGTGAGVFQTSPTITTPTIDTITSAAATALTLKSAGTTAVTIDTSQNVGIGGTPSKKLQVTSSDVTDGIRLYSSDSGGEGLSLEWMSGYGPNRITADIESDASGGGGNFAIRVADTSATLQNRLQIDNAGNVGIGTTSPATTLHVVGQIRTSGSTAQTIYVYGAAGVKPYITVNEYGVRSWDVGAGYYSTSTFSIQSNQVNGVYLGGTATAWASASDERLKDIIEPINNALTKVNGLRSVIGKYKTDEEGVRRSFLIAQDIQTQFPEALESSDPDKLGVQYTDVIPLLVAAIKELKQINDTQAETINALTARIEALEGK
jgi:hypothetical protein